MCLDSILILSIFFDFIAFLFLFLLCCLLSLIKVDNFAPEHICFIPQQLNMLDCFNDTKLLLFMCHCLLLTHCFLTYSFAFCQWNEKAYHTHPLWLVHTGDKMLLGDKVSPVAATLWTRLYSQSTRNKSCLGDYLGHPPRTSCRQFWRLVAIVCVRRS